MAQFVVINGRKIPNDLNNVEIADGAADTQKSSEESLAASKRLHNTIAEVNGVIRRFNLKSEIGAKK